MFGNTRFIPRVEHDIASCTMYYSLFNFDSLVLNSLSEGDSKYTFTLPLLRYILQQYGEFVPLKTYVPDFPTRSLDSADYEEQFLQCVDSEEFAALMKQQILPSMKKYQLSL